MSYDQNLKIMRLFEQIKVPIDMSNFDGRLVLQKEVYLLQEMGLHFGFSYGWYRRGPYSPAAAEAGFDIQIIQVASPSLPELTRMETIVARRMRELLDKASDIFSDLNIIEILELLASLHFIKYYSYPKIHSDHEARQQLEMKKPQYIGYAERALPLINDFFPER